MEKPDALVQASGFLLGGGVADIDAKDCSFKSQNTVGNCTT